MDKTRLNSSTRSLQIPEKYGETMIVLMVVGPNRLYVFWEINTKDILALKDQLGNKMQNSKYILRVYDVSNILFEGKNAHCHFDIEIDKDAENWYIDLWSTGNSYCVELGIKTNNRNFSPLARSNCVSTPRAEPSNLAKPKWMKVEIEHDMTSLQPKQFAKHDVMIGKSGCNDNVNSEIYGDINTVLIDYRLSLSSITLMSK